VKSIVRELNGEKIDIINYFEDPEQMVYEALKPAVPREIIINERDRRIQLMVAEDDLAIAIGRKGQNARLTSRLIGWKIDIEEWKEETVDVQDEATKKLASTLQVDGELAERLITAGFVSLDIFEGVEADDLEGSGFTAEEATDILSKVAAAQGSESA
jgi:N utilization substance protein A